ncbi:permease [Desulfobotulus mexicanus]|uniref:Permease n=2 Tax=Desulfobotulus mexicanus TaxID=2586642 RepID=A0A5S5MF13_9BACT|nr:permease [Desulfobotulus mexicanus]
MEEEMDWMGEVIMASWNVLVASAPYMLLGFFVAGLLKAFLPDSLVSRHLGGHSFGSIFKASALGVPMPLCSCGVLPTAAGLRQQGAGKGPTAAFLISTPETGVDSIAVTWALLDPFMAVIRPISAFFTAMVTGGIVQVLDRKQILSEKNVQVGPVPRDSLPVTSLQLLPMAEQMAGPETSCHGSCCSGSTGSSPSFFQRFQAGMAFAFGDLFKDIALWFMVGVLIAGAIAVFITPEMITFWLGSPLVAMLVMVAIAVPLYVCATASTPIAAALVLKGLNPGAALVFLLAGPAVNAASLTVISRILGKGMTVVYVSGIIVCALAMGFATDWFYGFMGGLERWQTGTAGEEGSLISIVSALILLGLFAWKGTEALWQRWHGNEECVCGHCH